MWIKFINKLSVMIVQEYVLHYFITEKQIVFYMHVTNSMNMNQSVYACQGVSTNIILWGKVALSSVAELITYHILIECSPNVYVGRGTSHLLHVPGGNPDVSQWWCRQSRVIHTHTHYAIHTQMTTMPQETPYMHMTTMPQETVN